MLRKSLAVCLVVLFLACVAPTVLPSGGTRLDSISLPDGFNIELYAEAEGARSLEVGEDGVVFVGTRGEGKVYAVVDEDLDRKTDRVEVVAEGLDTPNGVAYANGTLYVAEISRILKFEVAGNQFSDLTPQVVYDGFPSDTHHGWKFISIGPDGKLYVPVGAPCNVCEQGESYANIQRMDLDGSDLELFAEGVRNTVGFDWDPETGELWFTDNGRDWMGDNRPPDELNHAPERGLHFGFPYCHGGDIQDPEFDNRFCDEFTPPEVKLGPHVASLGMRFYTGGMFPEKYVDGIFIAEHGSWNRAVPIGYRVTFVKGGEYETFAQGWLQGGNAWGRPVDVEILGDGSLIVSDDKAGAIYRISYSP